MTAVVQAFRRHGGGDGFAFWLVAAALLALALVGSTGCASEDAARAFDRIAESASALESESDALDAASVRVAKDPRDAAAVEQLDALEKRRRAELAGLARDSAKRQRP